MSVKLLTEHHMECLCLTGGCTGSSESTLVKMPHFWKSHVTPHLAFLVVLLFGVIFSLLEPFAQGELL